MTSHTPIIIKKQKSLLMSIKPFTLIKIIATCLTILLTIDTFFYFQTQTQLKHQLEQLQGPSQAAFHFKAAQRGGWPFGSWIRLSSPRFKQNEGALPFSCISASTLIGGTWDQWIKGALKGHAFPVRFEGQTIIAFPGQNYATLVTIQGGSFYRPHNKIRPDSFSFPQASIETLRGDKPLGSVTLYDITGTIMPSFSSEQKQLNALSADITAQHAKALSRYKDQPLALTVRHMHLAFQAQETEQGTLLTLQDYSIQLPSLARAPSNKTTKSQGPVPTLSISGKILPHTVSGSVTLKLDGWRELVETAYHHFGKTITGTDVSPSSEMLLDKLLGSHETLSGESKPDAPLVMTARLDHGALEAYDLGALQPLFGNLKGWLSHIPATP